MQCWAFVVVAAVFWVVQPPMAGYHLRRHRRRHHRSHHRRRRPLRRYL